MTVNTGQEKQWADQVRFEQYFRKSLVGFRVSTSKMTDFSPLIEWVLLAS